MYLYIQRDAKVPWDSFVYTSPLVSKGLFHDAVYTLLCTYNLHAYKHTSICADITLFCRNAIPQDRSKNCSARQAKKCGYKTKTVKILQSKKKSRFCHASNGSAIQEITRILWNLTIHYRLVPTARQWDRSRTDRYNLNPIKNQSTYARISCTSAFPTKIQYAFPSYVINKVKCKVYPITGHERTDGE